MTVIEIKKEIEIKNTAIPLSLMINDQFGHVDPIATVVKNYIEEHHIKEFSEIGDKKITAISAKVKIYMECLGEISGAVDEFIIKYDDGKEETIKGKKALEDGRLEGLMGFRVKVHTL